MKVLFANPPTYSGVGSFNRPVRFPTFNYATPVMHPPLLLTYAAAYIRSRGHTVRFIDAQVDSIDVGEFVLKLESISPDYVIFETSTASFQNDIKVASEMKEHVDCKVVFVGPHVSALPIESMRGNRLDAVAVGEYELTLGEYVEKGPNKTKGICYRDDRSKITLNPSREYIQDLDALPFPARDLIPNYKYFDPILKNPFTFVLGGRGCPYRCIFCNWPQTMTGRRYRHRTPRNIVDELEVLEEEYRFRSFLFNDDTFTVHKRHAMEVCDEIIERGINIPWGCYSRADNTDGELLRKMREAGCFLLKVGIESGDQEILSNAKKGYKIEDVIKGVHLMKDFGFDVHCTFVIGLPGETQETIEKTIEFAKRINPTTVQFSTAIPYPGTELHRYLKGQGYLLTEDWGKYMPMQPIFEYPNLSAEEMCEAVKKAYRKYYFRPGYVKVGFKKLWSEPRTVIHDLIKLVKLSFTQ